MASSKKTTFQKINLFILIASRRYPALPYLLKWLLLSLAIGLLVGIASAGFLQSLEWVTNYREAHRWIIILLPIGGLATGLIYHYWGKDVLAGNNLILATIHEPKTIIPFRMAPLIYIGTLITHLFGGSAGREGTALQLAGAIVDQFNKFIHFTQQERKTLMVVAVAAGFGSVFGTPLAGAIFGIEVFLIGKLNYRYIFPAFASSIIADLVTKLCGAQHTVYTIPTVPIISFSNLGYAVIAGIIFGCCAFLFSRFLHQISTFVKRKITYPPLRPVLGGIVIVALIWALGTTKYIGLGIPAIVEAFHQQAASYDFAVKMALTILTVAVGFKGGEVTPLFFIGATLGSALSLWLPLPVGLLAGMGFVAVFSGATNTPLACTIMAIELFGSSSGVYVAVACTISYLFSGHSSIYEHQRIGTAKYERFSHQENQTIDAIG